MIRLCAAARRRCSRRHPSGGPLAHVEELRDFYADSAGPVLWVRGDGLSSRGRRLDEAFDAATSEGLDPANFRTEAVIQAVRELGERDSPETSARAEVLLSDAYLRLADALARGWTDPADAGLDWEIRPDSVPWRSLLDSVAQGVDPQRVLEGLRPTFPWYGQLRDALAAYREQERAGGWPSVPPGPVLQNGDSSPRVAAVRARLRAGMDPEVAELAEGGNRSPERFDADLAAAVARFQRRYGIPADSVVGETTVSTMNISASERVADLELNLDRMRRMPRSLGDRAILVNVAGFELEVLEHDRPVMEMGVVVGQPDKRTNIFQDTLQYLVVNPYWHVPESIEREEILPALRRDAAYLDDRRLELVDEGDAFGPARSPEDIDWVSVDTASFPYDFRQKPGPTNALGIVKFMLPNTHDIYLHDTPADHLFARDFRAFSHGCIRVEEPQKLARYVLRNASDTPPGRLDELVRQGERTRLDLDQPIPVYIAYFTAWVGKDGMVRFYPDVYDRDRALRLAEARRGSPTRRSSGR